MQAPTCWRPQSPNLSATTKGCTHTLVSSCTYRQGYTNTFFLQPLLEGGQDLLVGMQLALKPPCHPYWILLNFQIFLGTLSLVTLIWSLSYASAAYIWMTETPFFYFNILLKYFFSISIQQHTFSSSFMPLQSRQILCSSFLIVFISLKLFNQLLN